MSTLDGMAARAKRLQASILTGGRREQYERDYEAHCVETASAGAARFDAQIQRVYTAEPVEGEPRICDIIRNWPRDREEVEAIAAAAHQRNKEMYVKARMRGWKFV